MFIPALALSFALASTPSAPAARTQSAPQQVTETICPVTGKAIPPGQGVKVQVRDRDYLTFDAEAAAELKTHPETYLMADGTPKNAARKE